MPKQQFPKLKEFTAFIIERWNMHLRRAAGKPEPWTKDPILSAFRFTNVRREDDRVTRWIHTEWLNPHKTDYDTVVFAMCVARLLNLPASLEAVGYPTGDGWLTKFKDRMAYRSANNMPVFTSAYMINAVGAVKGELKSDYLARRVLPPLWKARKDLGAVLKACGSESALRVVGLGSLREMHNRLMQFHGFGGGFMSAQVVADVKHTPAGRKASDWVLFANSGPGSRRGLGWVCGDVGIKWKEEEWYATLMDLRALVLPKLPAELKRLDAQNLQNCLCEFSKYCVVKFAGGCVKRTFKPSEEPYEY